MASEVFKKLDSLPTLPNVASTLMRMAAEDDVQVEEVVHLIEADPSTSAHMLKVVNSAYRGLQGKVSSVNRAVLLMGVNGVRNALLSMQVFQVFGEVGRDTDSELFEIWKHCLAVASAAEIIAENTGGMLPEDAFTAGLLHDIGKIALYAAAPEGYREVFRMVADEGVEISDAEKTLFEITHTVAGRYITESWGLPEAVCQAAYSHHSLPAACDPNDQVSLTCAIVAAADDIVRRQRIGFSGTRASWEPLKDVFGLIDLSAGNIDDILVHLVERISLRSAILDIDLPTSEIYNESLQKANLLLGQLNEELAANRFILEHSQKRLQLIAELNQDLGSSFDCQDALAGVAEKVHKHLGPGKVITYCIDEKGRNVMGAVKNGSTTARPFTISAVKGAANDISSLGSDRDALLHIVGDLAGKLDSETGLSTLARGRLMFVPVAVGQGQRAGLLVEGASPDQLYPEDLQFFGNAAALFLERALAENRLRRETEKLLESNRRSRSFYEKLLNNKKLAAIGRMAAGAAHEINNPLAIVSGRVQLLLKMESEESKKRHLDMIRSQCDRMGRIVADILTFGKPEKPAVTGADLPEIIDSSISLIEADAAAKDISFERNFPALMPQITADAAKLEQAFRNILANGVDASEEGGRITIGAELAEKDRFLAVTFADNGEGMDQETVGNIFEPFFTTKEGRGTGLGLAICHSIIASHGGKIRVRSAKGEGTVFTVFLPVWRGK